MAEVEASVPQSVHDRFVTFCFVIIYLIYPCLHASVCFGFLLSSSDLLSSSLYGLMK